MATSGDPLALEIFEVVGRRLGQGLAILIDVLNPQRIIIGSIFGRQRHLLEAPMMEVLRAETIPYSLAVCDIVPPGWARPSAIMRPLAVAVYGAMGKAAP